MASSATAVSCEELRVPRNKSPLISLLHFHNNFNRLQDFSRDVLRIDAIPTKKLDAIRDWLVSVKIK